MADKPTVATMVQAYEDMRKAWHLPQTLMGGTRAMRREEQTYLPKEPREEIDAYRARLNRSILFNGFRRTVKVLSSKPLAHAPIVEGSFSKDLKEITEDPDMTGRGPTNFTRDLLVDMMTFGKTHILPDFPVVGEPLSRAEEKANGIRPYLVRLSPISVFAWRGEMVNGREVMEQLRYKVVTREPDGPWGEKEVERIVVWYRDRIERYVQVDPEREPDKWDLDGEAVNTLGYIPLVTIYANQTGFLTAETPLEDLAYINLRHWQSKSDQDTILHVARVPLLHFSGFDKDKLGKAAIGPFNAFFGDKDSKVKFVEHTGKAIEAGEKDLEKLEDQMRVMGADLLVEKPGNETATARVLDSAEKVSDLSAMTMNVEDGLAEAYRIAGEWRREKVTDLTVQLSHKFGLTLRDAAMKEYLLKARVAGELSRQTFLEESKRYGFLVDDLDVDKEIQRIEAEQPGTGLIGEDDLEETEDGDG